MTAQAQKPDSVFQRNGRVHLYRRGCQFSRVLTFLECGSAENDCSNTGWTVPSQAEDCWLPTLFASFPFTSPPVRRRLPPDSVSTLPHVPKDARDPSIERSNCVGELAGNVNSGFFYMPQICDPRVYFPSEGSFGRV